MIQRRVKLIIAVFLVVNIAFFTNFAFNITGYSSFAEFMQATWNYVQNALDYYLGISLPNADFLVRVIILLGAFLVVAITLYVIDIL